MLEATLSSSSMWTYCNRSSKSVSKLSVHSPICAIFLIFLQSSCVILPSSKDIFCVSLCNRAFSFSSSILQLKHYKGWHLRGRNSGFMALRGPAYSFCILEAGDAGLVRKWFRVGEGHGSGGGGRRLSSFQSYPWGARNIQKSGAVTSIATKAVRSETGVRESRWGMEQLHYVSAMIESCACAQTGNLFQYTITMWLALEACTEQETKGRFIH